MSTVFITGGSRGIGAAIARTFAFKGWNIAFSYLHSEEAAQALQNELSARGISVLAIRADAADPAQAAAFIERAVQELGAPDALVCSAGVALPLNPVYCTEELLQSFDRQIVRLHRNDELVCRRQRIQCQHSK